MNNSNVASPGSQKLITALPLVPVPEDKGTRGTPRRATREPAAPVLFIAEMSAATRPSVWSFAGKGMRSAWPSPIYGGPSSGSKSRSSHHPTRLTECGAAYHRMLVPTPANTPPATLSAGANFDIATARTQLLRGVNLWLWWCVSTGSCLALQ